MAKVERIEKWMDSGSSKKPFSSKSKKSAPAKKAFEISRRTGIKNGKLDDKASIQNIHLLLAEAPDTPDFFGKIKFKLDEPKKKGIFKKKAYPDLNMLRADLNTLTEEGKVDTHSRRKVRADIKNYPDVPDLHVINAVYTYQDIPRVEKSAEVSTFAHNKVLESQLEQLKTAIHEIVLAFYHGGLSVFNINWFMKVYIDYLNVYKSRLSHAYSGLSSRRDKESQGLASKLASKQAAINQLLEIKDRFGGINRISRRLNGTTYLAESFTPLEIRKATLALTNNEPNKVIVEDRRAGKIMAVLMVVLFLLAKVPILGHLVEEILNQIPEDNRSIMLKKRMISTIFKMTQFQLSLVGKDVQAARQSANVLYDYCLETIKTHLQTASLKEQYEVDAYLKAIWLVKSSDNLYSRSNYKEMINQAYKYLKVIQSDRNQLSDKNREVVVDLANKYAYQLDTILEGHGWLGEIEGQSWQNRD